MKKTTDLAFDRFWEQYPRKVGKLAAMKAWTLALRTATAEVIIRGIEQYKASKPEYADWCHPVTFLRQGRWMDEPDKPTMRADIRGHYPPCRSNTECVRKTLEKSV